MAPICGCINCLLLGIVAFVTLAQWCHDGYAKENILPLANGMARILIHMFMEDVNGVVRNLQNYRSILLRKRYTNYYSALRRFWHIYFPVGRIFLFKVCMATSVYLVENHPISILRGLILVLCEALEYLPDIYDILDRLLELIGSDNVLFHCRVAWKFGTSIRDLAMWQAESTYAYQHERNNPKKRCSLLRNPQ